MGGEVGRGRERGEEEGEWEKRERESVVSEMYVTGCKYVCQFQCVCVDCRASVEAGSLCIQLG